MTTSAKAIAIVGRAITILGAIQTMSHTKKLRKNHNEIDSVNFIFCKVGRAKTVWEAIVKSQILLSTY